MKLRIKNLGISILIALLIFLPFVISISVKNANRAQQQLQAEEISALVTKLRGYYSENIIGRIKQANGAVTPHEDFRSIEGGVPIPATYSIELGPLFDSVHRDGRIAYNFTSDYPFKNRAGNREPLSEFQKKALNLFRESPTNQSFSEFTQGGLFSSGEYRLATPVRMDKSCVQCHNSHPNSIKTDWKVGDVRGLQEVVIRGIRAEGFGNLTNIFIYSGIVCILSVLISLIYRSKWQEALTEKRYFKQLAANESNLAKQFQQDYSRAKLFESAIQGSEVAIAIADMRQADNPIIYVNDAFTATTGYTRDYAVGRNCRYLQGPATEQEELVKIRAALKKGTRYTGNITNYKSDGTAFTNMLTLIPIFDRGDSNIVSYYLSNQIELKSQQNDN